MKNLYCLVKSRIIRDSAQSIILLSLITCVSCSSKVDTAARKPSAQVEKVVTQLNESGAEIVLDAAGEVIAIKLAENTTPEVIATLTELSKLKSVDATETKLKEPDFADLKSQQPEVNIKLPL